MFFLTLYSEKKREMHCQNFYDLYFCFGYKKVTILSDSEIRILNNFDLNQKAINHSGGIFLESAILEFGKWSI